MCVNVYFTSNSMFMFTSCYQHDCVSSEQLYMADIITIVISGIRPRNSHHQVVEMWSSGSHGGVSELGAVLLVVRQGHRLAQYLSRPGRSPPHGQGTVQPARPHLAEEGGGTSLSLPVSVRSEELECWAEGRVQGRYKELYLTGKICLIEIRVFKQL